MSGEALEFVDSNVLVYAHDASAGDKQRVASALLDRLWNEQCGGLSVQTLQEFAVNITRKVPKPLTTRQALDIITALAEWRVHAPEAADVAAALELRERYSISFWDAMIVRSAKQLGSRIIWSEDLNAGQRYDGVELRNPFAGDQP